MPTRHESSAGYRYGYNGKELENDTDLDVYDYGARFYNPAVPFFWSIDPKADKYTFQSPYVYAQNNPVLYMDINGEGVETDFVNKKGKIIGTDGDKNGLNVLVKDKELEKVMRKIYKKEGKVSIFDKRLNTKGKISILPNDTALRESLDVFKRTVKNGGVAEECSLVMFDDLILRGDTGEAIDVKKSKVAKANLPSVPLLRYGRFGTNLAGNVEASIHSHVLATSFKDNGDLAISFAYNKKNGLDSADTKVFRQFRFNIIVGWIEPPKYEYKIKFGETTPKKVLSPGTGKQGISIYSHTTHLVNFDIRTVEKLIEN
jgi:RHS repeat-associated protein